MNWRTFTQVCIILGGMFGFHLLIAKDASADDFWRAVGSIATVIVGWGIGSFGNKNED